MNKSKNIIITSSILFVCLVIGIYVGIRFTNFRLDDAKFVIRDDVVSNVYKFSEFSKHLKDTAGDSNIYEIQGSDNTVIVAKEINKDKYDTLDKVTSTSLMVVKESRQEEVCNEVYKDNLDLLVKEDDAATCANLLLDGTCDLAALSYQDATSLIKENESLKEQLNLIDSAYITTFDSFALSVVKRYHYLINVNYIYCIYILS